MGDVGQVKSGHYVDLVMSFFDLMEFYGFFRYFFISGFTSIFYYFGDVMM